MMDEPLLLTRYLALALALTLALAPIPAHADSIVRVFYYGNHGSIYLGRRHAASWHGKTSEGFPEVVDLIHHGIATSDYSIPFGTHLCIKITDIPSWAHEEYSHLVGRQAEGVVTDRTASWVHKELGPTLDLWTALFRQLAGPNIDWERLGTFTARYWVCEDEKHRGRKQQ